MVGRFLSLAVVIAAVSAGIASIAGRTSADAPPVQARDDDNWTTRDRRSDQSPASTGVSSSGRVRLDRAADSHFYADADVQGRKIRMLVDSGASVIALTRSDAEAIGIDVDGLPVAGMARTAGGDVPMRGIMLESVELGGIEVRNVQAAVIDADMGVSLLGQSFLSRLDGVNVEGDVMTLR